MVLALNGNKKAEAYEWFFKMAGMSPVETKHDDPYKKVLQLIRQLEPYIRNNVIYNDLYVCDKTESSYGRNIGGEYLYSEISVSNPLLELYKSNKEAFKQVALRCVETEMSKIKNAMHAYNVNSNECIYIDGVGLIQNDNLSDACNTILNNLNGLLVAISTI
jgi:hypothetical protein